MGYRSTPNSEQPNPRFQAIHRFVADEVQYMPQIPWPLPKVTGDRDLLWLVFYNLLDNALKYTRSGGTVTIRAGVAQNQIVLQVNDTGIGIPSMDLPYIFDKFYRGVNANNETTGTGLGLSIVKSIVENHGGRIWVDSVLEKGTSLTVVLPLMDDQP